MELDQVTMHCEPEGELDSGERAYSPILNIVGSRGSFGFYTRRPWDLEKCWEDMRIWSEILAREKVGCFAAEFGGVEVSNDSKNPSNKQHWQIDKVKTHRGMWSYWRDNQDSNNH